MPWRVPRKSVCAASAGDRTFSSSAVSAYASAAVLERSSGSARRSTFSAPLPTGVVVRRSLVLSTTRFFSPRPTSSSDVTSSLPRRMPESSARRCSNNNLFLARRSASLRCVASITATLRRAIACSDSCLGVRASRSALSLAKRFFSACRRLSSATSVLTSSLSSAVGAASLISAIKASKSERRSARYSSAALRS